ncbi:MAG: siroheme synthase CysG [Pseudomonadota bacterium]
MDYLPVFMDMREKRALIVGGGLVASRKAALVAKSGPAMTVVSPEISDAMRVEVEAGNFRWIEREFRDEDVAGSSLVIAATDKHAVNQSVYAAASSRGIPVNVADEPELCSFILPAIVDRSPLVVAVSTGGNSPVLARWTKALFDRMLPARLGRLARLCGRLRPSVAERLHEPRARRKYWEDLLAGPIPDAVYAGRDHEAHRLAMAGLDQAADKGAPDGRVYLVGAGPGDPELMTLKGQRVLQKADVVLYDRLVPIEILEMCRREAEMVYVGKRNGDHPIPQQEISELLIGHATKGKCVVRLKGGDPFIFGRGGEELEQLAELGVPFEVVPGISSANGMASYAGIPLTHRDHAQSVSFWTGHTRDGSLDLDWQGMCSSGQTLVFFMGRANASLISEQLIEHGKCPSEPVALVQAATTRRQHIVRTSLATLPAASERLDLSLPTMIVIGSVVSLSSKLRWFEGCLDETIPVFPPHLSSTRVQNDAA